MVQITKPVIDAIFAQPESSGAFRAPQFAYARELGRTRPLVLLAFPPKSAGTFFRTAVLYAIGGQLVRTMHAQGGRDAQPYLPTFLAYYIGAVTQRPLVTHVHMMALPANRHFLDAFDIRPVMMRRAIPDMLASLSDMLDTDPQARKDGLNCAVPDDYPSWPQERKGDFLIDVIAPWYVNYFATWHDYVQEEPERVLVLDYAEIKSDPAAAIAKTVAHSRIKAEPARIAQALERAMAEKEKLRFNKGQSGRGGAFFDAGQLARLTRLIGYYPQLGDWAGELLGAAPQAETAPAAAGH